MNADPKGAEGSWIKCSQCTSSNQVTELQCSLCGIYKSLQDGFAKSQRRNRDRAVSSLSFGKTERF